MCTGDFIHGLGDREALYHRNPENIKLNIEHLVCKNPMATPVCYTASLALLSLLLHDTFYLRVKI